MHKIRLQAEGLTTQQREFLVMDETRKALREKSGKFVRPFCFKNEDGTRTSHYLVLVTKNITGYSIMKDIMAKESSTHSHGVPSFEFNPAASQRQLRFETSDPIRKLADSLLSDFSNRTVYAGEIFRMHSVDTDFVWVNYREALKRLESEGRIHVRRPPGSRKSTFARTLKVTFPTRGDKTNGG